MFYHILLFTNMFWSLLWPSSGCHTRIRTIYKLTHVPFIIFHFALERCPFRSIFEKPIFHSILAFLLCFWIKQCLYINGNIVFVFTPCFQDHWNYLINASFQYSICTTLIHSLYAVHKEKSNKMQQYIKILLFHIYMKLNIFRATHCPSSGA